MTHHPTLSAQGLADEKAEFFATAGCSEGNRGLGFRPAFLDADTGRYYLSAFADGRPAPVHVLDGLPPTLVLSRSSGRVCAVKASVVSGFVRDGRFYTCQQALWASEAEVLPLAA